MRNNQPVTQRERTFPAQQRLISTTDAKGVITYCNDAFVEISGFSREELVRAPHNLVRHPDVPAAVFAHMWGTLKQGLPWMGIVKNRCKTGDHYWVNAYVTPIFEGSQVVGYESVRVKPTAEQVRRAEALYQRINTGKSAIPKRDKWLPVLQDWLPFILVSQLSFMIGAWLNSHWGFALAAALSVPLGLLGLSWQQRGLKRLLRLAEQTTSDPLIAQMYTDSRGAQARLEMSILSQEARLKTCLTRLQDTAEHLNAGPPVRHPGPQQLQRPGAPTGRDRTGGHRGQPDGRHHPGSGQPRATHRRRNPGSQSPDRPWPRYRRGNPRSHPAPVGGGGRNRADGNPTGQGQ